jgi:hypothetical protein
MEHNPFLNSQWFVAAGILKKELLTVCSLEMREVSKLHIAALATDHSFLSTTNDRSLRNHFPLVVFSVA